MPADDDAARRSALPADLRLGRSFASERYGGQGKLSSRRLGSGRQIHGSEEPNAVVPGVGGFHGAGMMTQAAPRPSYPDPGGLGRFPRGRTGRGRAGVRRPGHAERHDQPGAHHHLAAYHQGIEHYVTSFEFAGEAGGRLDRAARRPDEGREGGDWTLQRLVIETQPPVLELAADGAALATRSAEVLLETEIDSLDITVLKGGAVAVGTWARDHGYFLPPEPEVLEFYAEQPHFLAARFCAASRARGRRGEGTPIHVVIPTPTRGCRCGSLGSGASRRRSSRPTCSC